MSHPALTELKSRLHDVNALHAAVSIMDWDQQTYMPKGGAHARAEHVGILSRLAHEMFVDEQTGRLLETASEETDPDTEDAALVRVARRDYDLATKIPAALVAEKSRLSSQAHEEWVQARAENDFRSFAPTLERMFEIARREADCLGYSEHVYDALLDLYEEGATTAECKAMFDTLRGPVVELVRRIQSEGAPVDDRPLYGAWDENDQRRFTEKLVRAIGFDMERGRQDTAPHPFCVSFAVGDVRLTTRFKNYLPSAIMGSLHEAGHGMYEQGLPVRWDRTPLAAGASLGLHESQSRLWENIVGRSRAFWERFYPELEATFPGLIGVAVDDFYRMINKVQPSLIRVEADEVTYNLHVMVRFEIECDVLTGALAVRDMPDAWNAKYKDYLGLDVPTDADGCLQDVHWSSGSIGYFPTYTIGNLLSYQIWNALRRDLGDVESLIRGGEFHVIREWLTDRIYSQGRRYTPKQLVRIATGKAIDATDYIDGLRAKYAEIYRLEA